MAPVPLKTGQPTVAQLAATKSIIFSGEGDGGGLVGGNGDARSLALEAKGAGGVEGLGEDEVPDLADALVPLRQLLHAPRAVIAIALRSASPSRVNAMPLSYGTFSHLWPSAVTESAPVGFTSAAYRATATYTSTGINAATVTVYGFVQTGTNVYLPYAPVPNTTNYPGFTQVVDYAMLDNQALV